MQYCYFILSPHTHFKCSLRIFRRPFFTLSEECGCNIFALYCKHKQTQWEKLSGRNACIFYSLYMHNGPCRRTKRSRPRALKGNPSASDLVFGAQSPKWGCHSCLFVSAGPGPGAGLSKRHHMTACPISKMLLFELSEVRQSVTSPLYTGALHTQAIIEAVLWRVSCKIASSCDKNPGRQRWLDNSWNVVTALKSTWIQWGRKEADGSEMIWPSFRGLG